MEKFNYKINIEAPSKETADLLMDYICKDKIGLVEMLMDHHGKQSKEEKIKQPEPPKPSDKEKFLSGIRQFEKVIQIIERCVMDETALDRIAAILGINVQPENTKQ